MAKWRRGRGRVAVADGSWWVPRAQRGIGDDGEAGGGQGGVGTCGGDAVAACGGVEPGAAVVLEADVVPAGADGGAAGSAESG